MKIYTKTGDTGMTALVGGSRVSKTSPRLEAYGTLDELNSHIGLLLSLISSDALRSFLLNIQSRLFDLGAYLATPADADTEPVPPKGLPESEIAALEAEIDRMTAEIPPLNSFILPGGCTPACQTHVCRTVCRRAERRLLAIIPLPHPSAIAYLNRLSDYLFTLARFLNHLSSTPEIPWQQN